MIIYVQVEGIPNSWLLKIALKNKTYSRLENQTQNSTKNHT